MVKRNNKSKKKYTKNILDQLVVVINWIKKYTRYKIEPLMILVVIQPQIKRKIRALANRNNSLDLTNFKVENPLIFVRSLYPALCLNL